MLRAAWVAQELLSTFGAELESVVLAPSDVGVFVVAGTRGDSAVVVLWDRKVDGGFPSAKELKRRVKLQLMPSFTLGKCVAGK